MVKKPGETYQMPGVFNKNRVPCLFLSGIRPRPDTRYQKTGDKIWKLEKQKTKKVKI